MLSNRKTHKIFHLSTRFAPCDWNLTWAQVGYRKIQNEKGGVFSVFDLKNAELNKYSNENKFLDKILNNFKFQFLNLQN